MEITVDDRALRTAIDKMVARGKNPTPALVAFYQDWKAIVAAEWSKIRGTGGTFRGQDWAGFADQYTRKTDDVTVTAWGGQPRIAQGWNHVGNRINWEGSKARRGRKIMGRHKFVTGNVKGKLRPSGRRVKETSVIGMDTGRLKGDILVSRPIILNKSRLRIGGDLPIYAEHILKQHNRNPLFWKMPEDQDRLINFAVKWIDSIAYEFNRGSL